MDEMARFAPWEGDSSLGGEVAYPRGMTTPEPSDVVRESVDSLADAGEKAIKDLSQAGDQAVKDLSAAADKAAQDIAQTADAAVKELAQKADDAIDRVTGVPLVDGAIETFTDDGSTIIAETRGQGAQSFLLVHGIGMGRKVFADVVSILERDSTVIAIDLPGFGEAPEPARTPTIERMADTVAAFIRHRGLTDPVVIGHSMGTQVVVEIAARHPDLTDRIVLVAPTVDSAARGPLRQLLRLGQDLLRESPRVLLLGAREYLRAGPNLGRKMRAMLAHRPEDSLPKVRARTLVLRGENDPVCPDPWCRMVADGLEHSEFAVIAQHGHETMISDGAPAAEAIREWLAR